MPYKIVQTIEKGKSVLTTVPSTWEKDGILFWSQKNQNKLRKIEKSEPEENWLNFNCILKRSNLITLQKAEYEMSKMCNNSETETDENDENYRIANQDHMLNFDNIVQKCIRDQDEFVVSEEPNQEPPELIDEENVIIIAQENSEQPQQSFLVQQSATSDMQIDRQDNLLAKMNVIIESNQSVLETIKTLQDNQKVLFENQQSIMLNLSQISVQIEQSADKKQNVEVQVIANIEELQKFENLLVNPDE